MGLINASTLLASFLAMTSAFILGYILFKEILGTIRQFAIETDAQEIGADVLDEVQVLSARFQNLIEDVDKAQTKLDWFRTSVRNPLTSVKIRLFSMERTLALSLSQKEDFEVISAEISHIDTIVGNFLEFSTPPKLKMQTVSPSDAVDMALQLLRHRRESYDVKVEVNGTKRLSEIQGDPDQLKEVFVITVQRL